jgi:uncharacterized protein YndB with AHSA1/START domain
MNDTAKMNDTIVVEIDIDAPPERVFQAWIDPQQRLAWWGDDGVYRGQKMESDLRVGGKWLTEGKSAEGKDFSVSGTFTRIEAARALGFTWNHDWGDGEMPETHVLIELTPTSSGTHVTLTHSGFTSASERDGHNKGWQRVLGWLQSYLQRK